MDSSIENINKNYNQIKIIDAFIFYNELDLLNYRLNILNNVVDYFIIVEANQTFTGNEKNLIFNENKNLYTNLKDKIIHIIVDLPYKYPNININNNEQWHNEKYQKNSINFGLDKINLNDKDIIIISDLDEIPDPNTLYIIKNNNLKDYIYSLEMDFYYYNLNSKLFNKWYSSKLLSYKTYNNMRKTCDEIRCNNDYIIIKNGGWHLSYFGDSKFIKNKIENFSHQEFNNNNFTNIQNIEENINNCKDIYNRDDNKIEYILIKDNSYLPPQYLSKFIFKENKKDYDIIICIFDCDTIDKYITQIDCINNTLGNQCTENNNVKLLYFLGEETNDKSFIENNYIHLKGVKDDYLSESYKQYLGLKYIYENYKPNFIFICNKDTYVNIPKLLNYLNKFNYNDTLYIGRNGDVRIINNKNIYYHYGETGFIISYMSLKKIYPFCENIMEDWLDLCKKNNLDRLKEEYDVSLSYYLQLPLINCSIIIDNDIFL